MTTKGKLKLLGALGLTVLLGYGGYRAADAALPYTAAGARQVENEGRDWAQKLSYNVVGVTGRNDEPDGDGYVSVVVNVKSDAGEERIEPPVS